MKILVVSLQKLGNDSLRIRHALIDVERETRGQNFWVAPHPALDKRTHIKKEEVDKVRVEMNGMNIVATVWALNESDKLSQDMLHHWKREVKVELMKFLKRQNEQIKQVYNEAINL